MLITCSMAIYRLGASASLERSTHSAHKCGATSEASAAVAILACCYSRFYLQFAIDKFHLVAQLSASFAISRRIYSILSHYHIIAA